MEAHADALSVILRLQNLTRFRAGLLEAQAEVRGLGVAAKQASAESAASAGRMNKLAGVGALVKKSLLGIGIAAGAAAFEGFKLSTDFDQQMTLVQTQAGASHGAVKRLSDEVLHMRNTEQGPVELAKALYHLKSVGVPVNDLMKDLRVTSNLAAVGQANLEDSASALAAAWLTGIKGAGDFHHTAAVLNATVGSGNMRLGELIHALGTGVLPAAKTAGLGLTDVSGVLALLSDEGYQASSAAAQFSTALHFIYAPTAKAEKAMKKMGLSSKRLALDMRSKNGLSTALHDLRDHLEKLHPGAHFGQELDKHGKPFKTTKAMNAAAVAQSQELAKILPGGRGRVMLALLNNLDRYDMKLNQVKRTTGSFHQSIEEQNRTVSHRLKVAWSDLEKQLVMFGHEIKGPASVAAIGFILVLIRMLKILMGIPKAIKAVIDWYQKLPGPLKLIITFLGLMAAQSLLFFAIQKGILLVTILWGLFTNAIEVARIAMYLFMTTNPLLLALAALIAVTILVITHWKQVKRALLSAWSAIVSAWRRTVQWIKNAAMNALHFLKHHWQIVAILGGPFGLLLGYIITHWRQIYNFIRKMPGRVKHATAGMWDGIKNGFRSALNWIIRAWNGLQFHIGGQKIFGHKLPGITIGTPNMPTLYQGGQIIRTGPVVVGDRGPEVLNLPTGALVRPLERVRPIDTAAISGGGHATIHVPVYLGRRQVAEATAEYHADRMARR